ncbi:glycosyltransferase [Lewinella sp. JB7]|uniref:glycosyltransferase n=1 Tax=Lewinella sp. JB7 TaxID=2962887 RepID=UPI0020C9AAE0|nr:glycosyltransferase [Lewinella sp. JB7]MCP9234925.1 glycosyltransferase [Lewinella sp. JB7]
MPWLAAVPLLISLAYVCWQYYNYACWLRTSSATPQAVPPPLPTVAIVVPFRNEAARLPDLVKDLLAQDYPPDRFEIILVDDFSTDGGAAGALFSHEKLTLLRLADDPPSPGTVAFKKAALGMGISRTTAEVIVTTDADCRWPRETLTLLGRAFGQGSDVVLGPVFVSPVYDLGTAFQALDLAGFQLFTAATIAADSPALANGAHFAFRRAAFERVGGYAGVDHLPSGDDVLLLHKFAHDESLKIAVVTDPAGLVTTAPVRGWRALWWQRLRWAGKAGNYTSPALNLAQVLAFLTSLGIVGALVVGLFSPVFLLAGITAWSLKGLVDFVLLRSVCRHYGHEELMRWYLPVQLIYPVYLVAVGSAAVLGIKAGWKDRPPA